MINSPFDVKSATSCGLGSFFLNSLVKTLSSSVFTCGVVLICGFGVRLPKILRKPRPIEGVGKISDIAGNKESKSLVEGTSTRIEMSLDSVIFEQ